MGERDRQALRQHHLHHVAGGDVLLDPRHRRLEPLLGETGSEIVLADLVRATAMAIGRGETTEVADQLIDAALGPRQGVVLLRIGVDDDRQLAAKVVEDHDLLGEHQQDVRVAERVS